MASYTPLNDLADNFFICSVCLDQLKEPKLLPCLHRYCSDCLDTVILASDDWTLKCPMCKKESSIPADGVDGFKTDFHMKSMLEFIQLQSSFEKKESKKCISCSQTKIPSAYCFKCKQFLCEKCYQFHLNNPMFTDHKSRTLNLANIEAQNITLEKLASLTDDPLCHIHVKQQAQLCCSTCGNVPVCVTCTYSKHKGHDLYDVTDLATIERESLILKLAELTAHKSKIYVLSEKTEMTTLKLYRNIVRKTETLISQHKQQEDTIKYKLLERTTIRCRGLSDIEKRRKDEHIQINVKQEEIIAIMERKYDKESEDFKEKCDEIEGELLRKLESLDGNLKDLTTANELLTEQIKTELNEISDYYEQIIKRYENFTTTTSSILASKDEWTDVQCIPDIRAASEPLLEDMKKEFPHLESLSDFVICDITKVVVDDVTITEFEEYDVNTGGIKSTGWKVNGLTISGDGNIVMTGMISNECSHITVINKMGEIQRHDQIKRTKKYHIHPERYCCLLSEFKVITVCVPDEIGIYDVRDGSYKKKNISDVMTNWRYVLCVAIDDVTNHIFVGTSSRYVYVFDDQLNHNHTITLPDIISTSYDITAVHGCCLLICDSHGKRTYSVSMEEQENKLMFEFTKPDLDGSDWEPRSVCTDKNGFIYLLWNTQISGTWKSILVQYSQDGRRLLTTISVAGNAVHITTLLSDGQEKLLIVTGITRKLYIYGLVATQL